ncbi:MAG TPA: hypothetical protein V6C95_21345 [Coleofasciculaceae cyanobacterium]
MLYSVAWAKEGKKFVGFLSLLRPCSDVIPAIADGVTSGQCNWVSVLSIRLKKTRTSRGFT